MSSVADCERGNGKRSVWLASGLGMVTRRCRQIVIRRPGGYRRLELVEADVPPLRNGTVLIDVAAVGVNFADCVVRLGLYESAKRLGYPLVPGFELAGTVVASEDDSLAVGQRVIGVTLFGAYASHVVLPATQCFLLPDRATFEEGAAFSVPFITAHYALRRLAGVSAGARVLVHSAAGGVGSALLQLARKLGCEATAVVGAPHKVPVARELGASTVIDRSSEPLQDALARVAGTGFDCVLDASGPSTLRTSYRSLAPMGRLIVYGSHEVIRCGRSGRARWPSIVCRYLSMPRYSLLRLANDNHSVMAFNLSTLFERIDLLRSTMSELLEWWNNAALRLPIITTYRLSDAAEAHRALHERQTVGKLVLLTRGS